MTINTNPLSYNGYVEQVGILAVSSVDTTQDPYVFVDTNLNNAIPQMLNYAELRIQRDLDLLTSVASNSYALTPMNNILSIPIDDFLIVRTLRIPGQGRPLTPVSREYIQNVYDDGSTPGMPKFFAMIGDNWGDGADTYNNVLLGPTPAYAWNIRVSGNIRLPSLNFYNTAPASDSTYTYISTYYPDMLLLASMIFVSAYQRNWSTTSDDPQMPMNYEKQYQALRLGAIEEENRKKQQGSAWSGYSTPTAATPTR